ncbi:hypothetical protein GCM10027018_04040 [Paenibacillus thermoaerophilus]
MPQSGTGRAGEEPDRGNVPPAAPFTIDRKGALQERCRTCRGSYAFQAPTDIASARSRFLHRIGRAPSIQEEAEA